MLFCPKCTENLHITDRQGIEIDFCPVCRGVWLDAGELEKIIDRTIKMERQYFAQPDARDDMDYHNEPRYSGNKSGKYAKKKKKKHVLEEIFDIFD